MNASHLIDDFAGPLNLIVPVSRAAILFYAAQGRAEHTRKETVKDTAAVGKHIGR